MQHTFRVIKRVLNENNDMKMIYPVHLNPLVCDMAKEVFGNHDRIHLIRHPDVLDFHKFMRASYFILIDSGDV